LNSDAIQRRVCAGRLHRLYVGVYAVGHRRLLMEGRWMAAVLACGRAAVLSHRDAAALWTLLPSSAARVHVTAPGRTRCGQAGILLHLPRHLHPEDRAERDRIPVTSVARTLLDLAAIVELRQLRRALEQAERLGVFDMGKMERSVARCRGRRGIRALRAALEDYRSVPFTRSELERRFLDLCRDAGLPRPAANLFVAGAEVDMVWPDERLVVELDGHDYHRTHAAFERDRLRDTALQLAGYRVLRVTHRRLQTEPVEVVRAVRSLLDRV
jgi:hypothetical protein